MMMYFLHGLPKEAAEGKERQRDRETERERERERERGEREKVRRNDEAARHVTGRLREAVMNPPARARGAQDSKNAEEKRGEDRIKRRERGRERERERERERGPV